MSELSNQTTNAKPRHRKQERVAGQPVVTGKCAKCGHAESSHKTRDYRGAVCVGDCTCQAYEPQADISAFNTLDGKPPVELYKFQRDYLEGLPPKYMFAADTGTGKTFMALAHYDHHAYLKPLLILAPASKVVTGDWERELKQYFAGRLLPPYEIYSYEKFSRVPSMAQYRKTGDRGVWRAWLQKHPTDFAIIADEVHKAKNSQSGVGKRVFEVSQSASFFVGLSATPARNGWIDMANYFKIFGLSRNITEFKKRYCNISTFRGFPSIDGYYHEEELKKMWNSISKPLNKDQALDLPPLITVPVSFKADAEYTKIQKERLFEGKFLDNPGALLHALRQATIMPKIPWLNEFLEGASGHVVIFYNYKSELKQILAMIKKAHKDRVVFQQNGDNHDVPPKQNWASLPPRTITLAQYQSGGTGIECTYANEVVYFSPSYSSIDYEQSIGRVYRNGQNKKVTLYMLCCPATIEREIWGALREKQDFSVKIWYSKFMENLEKL